MEIYNLIQESNCDGEIIVNVTPCASMEVATKVMNKEIETLISDCPKYKKLELDNPSDDFLVRRDETHVLIKKVYDDYYEEFTIEKKELEC